MSSPRMSVTSSGSDYPKSDAFSEATKLEVKRLAGNNCWACTTPLTQVCHVFGKQDPQMPLWYSKNLINFSLTSTENGIALCPTCHVQFDQMADPGFILLPTDLQYFIDFELNDHDERKLGNNSRRKVPTVEEYKTHQVNEGKVSADSIGGLYRPIFLQNYLVGGRLFSEILDSLSTPKPWHGAPIGTLRRGILVLGGGRVLSLDEETRSGLEKLRNLYFLNDRESSSSTTLDSRQPASTAQRGEKRRSDDELGEQNKRSKLEDSADEQGNNGGCENITSWHCSRHAVDFSRKWVLGPDFTADEAVRRYAPILSHE